MRVQEINALVLNHLRVYGFYTSARILENEIKSTPELRIPPKPSKLFGLIQLSAQRMERAESRTNQLDILEMHSPKNVPSILKKGLSGNFDLDEVNYSRNRAATINYPKANKSFIEIGDYKRKMSREQMNSPYKSNSRNEGEPIINTKTSISPRLINTLNPSPINHHVIHNLSNTINKTGNKQIRHMIANPLNMALINNIILKMDNPGPGGASMKTIGTQKSNLEVPVPPSGYRLPSLGNTELPPQEQRSNLNLTPPLPPRYREQEESVGSPGLTGMLPHFGPRKTGSGRWKNTTKEKLIIVNQRNIDSRTSPIRNLNDSIEDEEEVDQICIIGRDGKWRINHELLSKLANFTNLYEKEILAIFSHLLPLYKLHKPLSFQLFFDILSTFRGITSSKFAQMLYGKSKKSKIYPDFEDLIQTISPLSAKNPRHLLKFIFDTFRCGSSHVKVADVERLLRGIVSGVLYDAAKIFNETLKNYIQTTTEGTNEPKIQITFTEFDKYALENLRLFGYK